jgi:hypothetical protein
MPNVSERRFCGVISVPRSAVRERTPSPRAPVVDEVLAARLQRLIAQRRLEQLRIDLAHRASPHAEP